MWIFFVFQGNFDSFQPENRLNSTDLNNHLQNWKKSEKPLEQGEFESEKTRSAGHLKSLQNSSTIQDRNSHLKLEFIQRMMHIAISVDTRLYARVRTRQATGRSALQTLSS